MPPKSRKKAKGKARKAAKAQQQEEAAAAAAGERGSLHSQLQPRNNGNNNNNNAHQPHRTTTTKKCQHGFGKETFHGWRICSDFMGPFMDAFNASGRHDDHDLRAAMDSTYEKYSEVWKDPSKLEWVTSCFIANGTRYLLDGTGEGGTDKYAIMDYAIIAYFMQEYVDITLRKTKQGIMEWEKICELQVGNDPEVHELVRFYHARNPCKCLEKMFREGEKAMAMKEKKENQQQQQQQETMKKKSTTESEGGEEEESKHHHDHDGGHYEEESVNVRSGMNDAGLEYWKSLSENFSLAKVHHGGVVAEISPTQPSLN